MLNSVVPRTAVPLCLSTLTSLIRRDSLTCRVLLILDRMTLVVCSLRLNDVGVKVDATVMVPIALM